MDDPHVPQIKLEESWEEGKILQLDARDQIDELYTALTETERQVYREHYVQGFTLQEVAHHCHRSLVSVKASLRQIKRKAHTNCLMGGLCNGDHRWRMEYAWFGCFYMDS